VKEYHTNIVIKAPVGAVWKALTNFSAYPEWNPLVGWLKGDIRANGQIQMFIKPLNRSFTATLKRVEGVRHYDAIRRVCGFGELNEKFRCEPAGLLQALQGCLTGAAGDRRHQNGDDETAGRRSAKWFHRFGPPSLMSRAYTST
jgi:hypothetical protein